MHQSLRTLLFAGAALVAFVALKRFPKPLTVLGVGLVLLLDSSVNNKLLVASDTKLQDLSSSTFFDAVKGKSVVNTMDGFSQLYSIPEVLDVDAYPQYSAISNKYATDVANQMMDQNGQPRTALLRAAGVDGVLTTSKITSTDFTQQSSVEVTPKNVEQYYHYNPNGTIQNTWKGLPPLVGVRVSYYELKTSTTKPYIVDSYLQAPDVTKAIDFLKSTGDTHPAYVTGPADSNTAHNKTNAIDLAPASAQPTRSQFTLPLVNQNSLLVTHVPFSKIWNASIDGKHADTVLVNGGFVGVKLPEGSSGNVVLNVKHTSLNAALAGALLLLVALVAVWFLGLPPLRGKREAHVAEMKKSVISAG